MKTLGLLLIVLLFMGGIGLSAWLLYPLMNLQSRTIVSPLPAFLDRLRNNQVATLTLWFPDKEVSTADKNLPQITAKSALMYDLTTGKVLYEKNPNEKLPIASLTKVMTAIVALENPKNDDKYLVRAKSLVGEDAMGLTMGEELSLSELIYGLMLHSGNDAAEVLADNSIYGRDGFIKAMNQKAKALGLLDTNYTNPTGLQGDGIQYSTAYDLLVISRYALNHFPLLETVASTPQKTILQTVTHKEYYLENEINLITSYPGVKGLKTGYTPEAGLCLITYLDYKGHQIVGVLLGSENRRAEMKELLDYSLKDVGITPPAHT